jgi:hypothetical protein
MIESGDLVLYNDYTSRYLVEHVENDIAKIYKYINENDNEPQDLTCQITSLNALGKNEIANPLKLKIDDIVSLNDDLTEDLRYHIVDILNDNLVRIFDVVHNHYGGVVSFLDLTKESRTKEKIIHEYSKYQGYSGISLVNKYFKGTLLIIILVY